MQKSANNFRSIDAKCCRQDFRPFPQSFLSCNAKQIPQTFLLLGCMWVKQWLACLSWIFNWQLLTQTVLFETWHSLKMHLIVFPSPTNILALHSEIMGVRGDRRGCLCTGDKKADCAPFEMFAPSRRELPNRISSRRKLPNRILRRIAVRPLFGLTACYTLPP